MDRLEIKNKERIRNRTSKKMLSVYLDDKEHKKVVERCKQIRAATLENISFSAYVRQLILTDVRKNLEKIDD